MASSSSTGQSYTSSIPIEDILLNSGLTARWQFLIVVLTSIPIIPTGIIIMSPTFYKVNVPYNCASSLNTNASHYQDQCVSTECNEWIFNYTSLDVSSSIQESYNLVCDRDILIKVHGSVYFLGLSIGSLVSGYMSDRIGRVKWMTIAYSIGTIFCVVMAMTESYILHLIAWTFINVATVTGWICQSVITSEILPIRYRHYAVSIFSIVFGTGIASSALVNIVFPNWRHMVLFQAVCMFISILLLVYCHESPRWLWSSGRYEEACDIIRSAAQFGGNVIPADIEASLVNLSNTGLRRQPLCQTLISDVKQVLNIEKVGTKIKFENNYNESATETKTNSPSFLELFKSWTLCSRVLILALLWVCANTITYGVLFGGSLFKQQLHIYAVSQGLANCTGGLLTLFSLSYIGRKTLAISCLATSATIFMICILKSQLIDGLNSFVLLMMFCERLVVQTFFMLCFFWSAEMMPTVVRSSVLGFCSLMARVFGLAIPYVELLVDIWADLPLLFYGSFAFIVMVCAFFLPETRGKKLPDTIEEGKVFGTENLNQLSLSNNITKKEVE